MTSDTADTVRMGWAFRSQFRRSDISSAAALDIRPISRRAHAIGLPVPLREVLVSVSDVPRVAAALAGSPSAPDPRSVS